MSFAGRSRAGDDVERLRAGRHGDVVQRAAAAVGRPEVAVERLHAARVELVDEVVAHQQAAVARVDDDAVRAGRRGAGALGRLRAAEDERLDRHLGDHPPPLLAAC